MANLTDKQQLLHKLKALDQLGKHCGMWGPLRKIRERVYESRGEVMPPISFPIPVEDVLAKVLDSDAQPLERCACSRILDYYIPGWRECVAPQVLGVVTDRDSPEVAGWRRQVVCRDVVCQGCGADERLHAHHIMRWADFPELRLIAENGIALCARCHALEHEELPNGFVASAGGVPD